MEKIYKILLSMRRVKNEFNISMGELRKVLDKYLYEFNNYETRMLIREDLFNLLGRTHQVDDDTSNEEINAGKISYVIDRSMRITILNGLGKAEHLQLNGI